MCVAADATQCEHVAMASRQKGHQWRPIEDLSDDLRARRFPELDGLIAALERKRGELEGAAAVREFLARLVRTWSIETGILERIYSLNDSATLTLVEHGFDAALLSHGDSDLPPEQLVDILRDHQDAAEGLFVFVKGGRPLMTSYVKELHQLLTRHQPECDALDSHGNWVKVPLRRGDWKLLPNNVGDVRTGEVWHRYCPPEQVGSEMDKLVALHASHDAVHHVVEAAWLHHRFTQIHPFQDGNGRVARALASLVCIRAHGLPVVVLRDQKEPYIRALEQADRGDLAPLIAMFERQQREALLQAVSTSDAVMSDVATVDSILAAAKRRIDEAANRRKGALADIARELNQVAVARLQELAERVNRMLAPTVSVTKIRDQVARDLGQNLGRRYAKLHKYVPVFAGVEAASGLAFGRVEGRTDYLIVRFLQTGSVDDGVGLVVAGLVGSTVAGDAPFAFTADRDPVELRVSFASWLDVALKRGLEQWQANL
jgi:hypothetical protein